MSELTNDEKLELAYPINASVKATSGHSVIVEFPGMTLLDHFAGLAMQGDWAHSTFQAMLNDKNFPNSEMIDDAYELLANRYYKMAEAMMIARRKYEVKE